MSSSTKFERFVGREELPAFFRQLADVLEGKEEGELASLSDFGKLRVSVKDEFGQVTLKLKAKPRKDVPAVDPDPDAPADAARPKYGSLKKRMKSSFKLIYGMLHEGKMPPEAAVGSFLADSRLMITYPGKGDEYYDDYARACDEFEAASKAGDIEAMRAAAVELASQKGRCHAKYD